jgi:hypothetical protein
MRQRHDIVSEGPGQDSFLDVVANLVGILIILIMVVGVSAKDAMLDAGTEPAPAPAKADALPVPDVAAAKHAADAVQMDLLEIDAKIRQQQFDINYRRAERDRIQLVVQSLKDQVARRRAELADTQQQEFDLRRELNAARIERDAIATQVAAFESTAAPVTVLTHLPTPMAKTVFGRELHFQLRGGRLVHVPWDQLVEMLRDEAPQKMWRLKDQSEMTETLGPVGGFLMRYTLVRKQHAVQTKAGVAVQQGVELDHFVLEPVSPQIGETLDEAFRNGSALQTLLEAHSPDATTVTVWTYPDSYISFRQLKEFLFQRGYLTASRPLPDDYPIGGSPSGRRSAAQ